MMPCVVYSHLIFKDHFTLSSVQISMIIVMSYAGNLIFLAGTRLADRFEKKKVMMGILLIWMAALLVYVTTDNYYVLLITMLFTMGASTLMNTMINLFVPMYRCSWSYCQYTVFCSGYWNNRQPDDSRTGCDWLSLVAKDEPF